MPSIDQQVIDKILLNPSIGNIWIAFSGGLDSTALLHMLAENSEKLIGKKITAVHIDHGLQKVSSEWAKFCGELVRSYGINYKLVTLNLEKTPGESIELSARNARYSAFEQLLNKSTDTMLFAHHADDQVETFLQQAMRGAGVQGLSGIPESRKLGKGRLLRPLLDISRKQLEVYAKQQHLKWIEDPTNQQSDYDRNLLRNEIIPLLEKRWPGAKKALLRSASHCKEASEQIDAFACAELQRICTGNLIDVAELKQLDFIKQKNILRLWIRNNSIVLPNTDRFESGIESLLNAKADKNPILDWDFGIIRRYQGMLYIDKIKESDKLFKEKGWDLNVPVALNKRLTLVSTSGAGIGISKQCIDRNDISIRYRQGGERCRPFGRNGSHELKKIFQEYQIPPWIRGSIPIVYIGGEIACVVGCCYCRPFAEEGESIIKISQKLIET